MKANKDEFDTDDEKDSRSEWNKRQKAAETSESEQEADQTSHLTEYPDFPEFDNQIKNALNELGGKGFIKLNWSSPKDAAWSLNKLHCQRISDVYILLKSSDFITHDLSQAFETCSNLDSSREIVSDFKYYLVVREWISINPSMEFRCFVYKNRLIGFFILFYIILSYFYV